MLGLPEWMRWNRLVHVNFRSNDYVETKNEVTHAVTLDEINCVTSEVIMDGKVVGHYPIIDLDVPHFYTPSSTEGHGHLVLNVQLSEKEYKKLLDVLVECGIVQQGVMDGQWKRYRHTAMRLPDVKK